MRLPISVAGALILLVLASAAGAQEAPTPQAQVTLRLDFGSAASKAASAVGRLRLQPLLGGPDVRDVAVAGAELREIALPARTSWEIITEIEGWWAPRRVISAGSAGSRVVKLLRVWPTGEVAGRVALAAPGAKLPTKLVAVITAPPDSRPGERLPAGLVTCPINEEARWRCALPAGRLDVSFRAGGFVPHYRWGFAVRTDKPADIGTLRLAQGASVVGWVTVEDGELDPERCFAKLLPLQAPGRDPRVAMRMDKTLRQAKVNDKGFFQLTGLTGGAFMLEIEQPGFAPARLFPLELWSNSESRIEDELVLRKALTVEVVVTPPVDWQGRPWGVQVYRHADYSASLDHAPAFQGPVDANGRVLVPDQAPGKFWFMVSDRDGNDVASEWHVPILGPQDALQTFEIKTVTVDGTLTLGDEPLAGTIFFGGRHGDVSVRMEADDEGHFEGMLPRDGKWRLEIESDEPPLKERTHIELQANRRGEAKAEIALPDTKVSGTVVDAAGSPVFGASVTLNDADGSRWVRTDRQGSFRFLGMPTGSLQLTASQEKNGVKRVCQPIEFLVSEGASMGPFELRLIETKTFHAQVVSPGGGVAGAVVTFVPSPGSNYSAEETAGLDGVVKASLPAEAESVQAIIRAPGQALQAMRVSANERALLPVTGHGGTVEVEVREHDRRVVLLQNGIPLYFQIIVKWAWSHGGGLADEVLRVPEVAPGEYRYCEIIHPLASNMTGAIQGGACTSAYLGVGETVRLMIPSHSSGEEP